MGSRDFRHRETKKPKKDAKKPPALSAILPPPPTVEVVRKPRKEKELPEE